MILSSFPFRLFIPPYPFVQPVLHLFEEMRMTDGFPAFDVGVMTVAILCLNTEKGVKYGSKLFQRDRSVIDTAHLVDAVYHFHQVDGVARPA